MSIDQTPVGGPVEDARAAAVQAGVTAGAIGNDAKANRTSDVARKAEADQAWAQRANVIQQANPQDYSACLAGLNTAATAIATEQTQITAGDEHLAVGQDYVQEGDEATVPMEKIGKYKTAKEHYEAGESCYTTSNNAHNQADGGLDVSESILSQYG